MKPKLKKRITNVVLFIFSFWLTVSVILVLVANSLIFKNQYSQGPIKSYLEYDEVFIPYGKKEKLYISESFTKKSDPLVILFFHGNAGGVGRIINDLAPHHNIVAPAYPGYHLSSGTSNEKAIYKTVDLSMQYLKKQGILEENIIIFGASLGGTAALYGASKYPNLRNVIIVGTFDRVKSICLQIYSIFCGFTGGILNNISLAKETKAKISYFHSIDDEIVDFKMGKNLFKYINSNEKKFYQIKEGHNNFDAVKIIEMSLKD